MNFEWAMKQLRAGKHAARGIWGTDSWLKLVGVSPEDGQPFERLCHYRRKHLMERSIHDDEDTAVTPDWAPTHDDVMADDWEAIAPLRLTPAAEKVAEHTGGDLSLLVSFIRGDNAVHGDVRLAVRRLLESWRSKNKQLSAIRKAADSPARGKEGE